MKFFLLQSISGAHWVYCIFFCWGPLAAQGTLYVLTSRVFGQPRWLLRALGALTPNLGVAYPQPWSYLPPTLEVKTPRGGNFLSGCRKFRGGGSCVPISRQRRRGSVVLSSWGCYWHLVYKQFSPLERIRERGKRKEGERERM